MKSNNSKTEAQNGKSVGTCVPKKSVIPVSPERIDEGKGAGRTIPPKKK